MLPPTCGCPLPVPAHGWFVSSPVSISCIRPRSCTKMAAMLQMTATKTRYPARIFTIWFCDVASRVNVPSSPLIVPFTNAESGRDNNTTFAYGNGWFCSSTSFPLTVCADKPKEDAKVHSSSSVFLSVFMLYVLFCISVVSSSPTKIEWIIGTKMKNVSTSRLIAYTYIHLIFWSLLLYPQIIISTIAFSILCQPPVQRHIFCKTFWKEDSTTLWKNL